MSIPILAAVAVAAALFGYFLRKVLAGKKAAQAERRAEELVAQSRAKAQEVVLEANEKALKVLDDAKKEESERRKQLEKIENLLTKKEDEIDVREGELKENRETVAKQETENKAREEELSEIRQKQLTALERVSGLSRDEAKEEVFKTVQEEYRDDLYHHIRKLEAANNEEIERKASEIFTMAVQRYAGSHIADATTTTVSLPSDDLKGKIIGKEGRNIKAIERLTGVDIIIDDTPGTLVVSGFDPVRRQIAKTAIEGLIADGRIHPSKIEEMVEKARAEINDNIKQAGEAALIECGVSMVDEKLVYLLGRLAYRTSYGQNVLLHSIEMAHVSGVLAQELGADVAIAKKGALFHDIGKAVDHEVQGTHVEIGRKILTKFGIDEKVVRAMESHHEEFPYSTLESRIVQAADAISAARPGARRDTVEIYLKRMEDLENIATSFEGVEKAYAIQAGRELRVFVTPARIDDLSALQLARDIAKRVEGEMQYPGEIKVNVIRETRSIEYAR